MIALLLAKNIHCRKKVCLINAFQKVPLNTDRFCLQYNYFNARLIRPRGKVYYDRVILIRRTLLVKTLLYSRYCNAICGLFNIDHNDGTEMLKEDVKL